MGPFLSEQKDDVMWQVEKLLKLTADAFFKRVSLRGNTLESAALLFL